MTTATKTTSTKSPKSKTGKPRKFTIAERKSNPWLANPGTRGERIRKVIRVMPKTGLTGTEIAVKLGEQKKAGQVRNVLMHLCAKKLLTIRGGKYVLIAKKPK